MALALLDDDRDELEAQAEDARVVCDPAISVADLEEALERYFKKIGYRNVDEILVAIKEAKCTWKTAPKARAWDLGGRGAGVMSLGSMPLKSLRFRLYVFKVLRP